jgi:hypothetical protein
MDKELVVDIDFDEASHYWNSNKKKLSNGCYRYVCGFQKKNGNFCKKACLKNKDKCNQHILVGNSDSLITELQLSDMVITNIEPSRTP